MNRMKKSVVAAGLAAGLLGGGAAGAILGTAGVSGAQETTTTLAQAEDGASAERMSPEQRLGAVLAPLVEAGTIDQAQADAVVEALVAARPERGEGQRGDGQGGHHRGPRLEAASEALGMTPAELGAALRDGQTIAQVAESKGVAVQTVIDAMVAELKGHLDERVASGDLTQAEADEKLADATERITDAVSNGRPERGGSKGGPSAED